MNYSVDMQNAIPAGRIESRGAFGPLNAKQIGSTPFPAHSHLPPSICTTSATSPEPCPPRGVSRSAGRAEARADSIYARLRGRRRQADARRRIDSMHHQWNQRRCGHARYRGAHGRHHGSRPRYGSGFTQGYRSRLRRETRPRRRRHAAFYRPRSPYYRTVWLHGHAYLEPDGHGARFLHRLHVTGAFDVPAERVTDQKTERASPISAIAPRAKRIPTPKTSPPRPTRSHR